MGATVAKFSFFSMEKTKNETNSSSKTKKTDSRSTPNDLPSKRKGKIKDVRCCLKTETPEKLKRNTGVNFTSSEQPQTTTWNDRNGTKA
mmetsp:Transcript_18866/g.28264  ORF Transcript_18866/g.28264 Transcript_18866/m.28264 type:complete len:89 (-) Transcript_18866:622-888(-)